MKNNINIAEFLKDCPKGMGLDCAIFENVTFEEVITARGFDDKKRVKIILSTHYSDGTKDEISLTEFGTYTDDETAKCVIFPKGKTTWDGFIPPYKFKDGDVCYLKTKNYEYIFIFKVSEDYDYIYKYANLSINNFYTDEYPVCTTNCVKEIRLATEEEKQKLFDAIKDSGYKWNAETKTLEKLIKPKFKVGDRIKFRYFDRKPTKVVKIHDERYELDNGKFLDFQDENAYEISYDKFDITTLKPFDKVLVRNDNSCIWKCDLYSHYSKYPYHYVCMDTGYIQCIPYEGNEHLLGTANDCDEYFKTWK